jgi:hypothetical protein
MKYDPNKKVVIATYADGGIVASVVQSESDPRLHYHYMCIFENESSAKSFIQENLSDPVFLTSKTMLTLAKEFNSSIIYPGMAGVVHIDANDMVEHIDVDSLIKMAYDSIIDKNETYGCRLVVDGKIAQANGIDFNQKYFIMMNADGDMLTTHTHTKNGSKKQWMVVATTKNIIKQQAANFGDTKKQKIICDTLSGLLTCFMPGGQFDGLFTGIIYMDKNGSKTITRKKIVDLLNDRKDMINQLQSQTDIYLDAKYFVSADKKYGMPTITEVDGIEYIVVSPRMDVMMKAFQLEGMDLDEMLFTNLISLREIVEGGAEDDYGGIAMCLDENPDHIAYIPIEELYEIALDGDGDEYDSNDMAYIYSDDEYMMANRIVMMIEGAYLIATMGESDTDESINVVLMGDDEDILRSGLESTGYAEENDRAIERPTYEIFAEFREGGQLYDCDGIMYFDMDGYSIIPKSAIIDALEEWEELTDKQSVRVKMDLEALHCIAMNNYKPLTFTQPDGTPFVLVASEPDCLEWALMELFGSDNDVVYDNSKTLQQIAESAVFGGMGIVMCDQDGLTFIEPKRLSQVLYEDDDS